MKEKRQSPRNDRLLWMYAGMAFQLLISLFLSVYAGMWLDRWLNLGWPLLVWILPLAVLVALMIKVIRDTTKGK
jgi:hypothetical protein